MIMTYLTVSLRFGFWQTFWLRFDGWGEEFFSRVCIDVIVMIGNREESEKEVQWGDGRKEVFIFLDF